MQHLKCYLRRWHPYWKVKQDYNKYCHKYSNKFLSGLKCKTLLLTLMHNIPEIWEGSLLTGP